MKPQEYFINCGWHSENSCKDQQRKYSVCVQNDERMLPACVGTATYSSHRNVGTFEEAALVRAVNYRCVI